MPRSESTGFTIQSVLSKSGHASGTAQTVQLIPSAACAYPAAVPAQICWAGTVLAFLGETCKQAFADRPHQFANTDPRYANGPTCDEMPQNVAMPHAIA